MSVPSKNPDVIFRRVDDGAVLLSARDEVYFGLNEVGAVIWELLTPELTSTDPIRDALVDRYPNADPDTIAADLAEVIAQMVDAGVLLDDDGSATRQ